MTKIQSFANFAAAISVAIAVACIGSSAFAQRAGVTSAVNIDAKRTPPGLATRQITIGDEIVYNERIDTDSQGQAQILMLDRTAITIGPNSSMVIDKFFYDPAKKNGSMELTLRRGLLRFVGGDISKKTRVRMKTPVGVMGVRGGIALIDIVDPDTVDATFLFGDELVMYLDGQEAGRIRTPGYRARLTRDGAGEPQKVTPEEVAQKMAQLQGRSGTTGGLQESPDAATVESQTEENMASDDGTILASTETNDGESGTSSSELSSTLNESQALVTENQVDQQQNVVINTDGTIGLVRQFNNTTSPTLFTGQNDIVDIEGSIDTFNNGDLFYTLFSPATPTSVLAGPADALLSNGTGPDGISNPFDATDLAVYDRPEVAFDALLNAGMDHDAAELMVGRVIFEDDFVHQTYREIVIDGMHDNRLTVTAGTPFTAFPATGVWAYNTEHDVLRHSRHLFSAVNQLEIRTANTAAFLANTFHLEDGASQTPLFIDWDRGKVFYASRVIDGDFLGQTEYAFQSGVVVGDIDSDGNFSIAGSEALSGRLEDEYRFNITTTDARHLQFYTDDAQYLTIGGVMERGAHTLDPVALDVGHLAERTFDTVSSPLGGSTTYRLITATRFVEGSGNLFSNLSSGNLLTLRDDPGSLTLDRDNSTVTATVSLQTPGGNVDEFTLAGGNFTSAYLNEEMFGIASFELTDGIGGFLVSGKASTPNDDCNCEDLLWGYWGLLEDNDTPVPANPRTQLGVFVAGIPTVTMPLTGSVEYVGVAEAAWRAPTAINPDMHTSYAQGTFTLVVDMASGEGFGTLDLANVEYDVESDHTPGSAEVFLTFTENGLNGGAGFGDGIFTGPNAGNLGASFQLSADDGMEAAGIIRADGFEVPLPTFPITGFARVTPSDPDIDLPSLPVVVLNGEANDDGFYTVNNGVGSLAGDFPDLVSNRSGSSTDILDPFVPTDTLIYKSPAQAIQELMDRGVDIDTATRLVGPVIDDGDFFALTYWSISAAQELEVFGTMQVVAGESFDLTADNSLLAFRLETDPVRLSRNAFSTVGLFDDGAELIADFEFVLDDATAQTPLYIDRVRGKVFLANKVEFGELQELTEYAFSVGVIAGTFDDTTTAIGSGELVFGEVGVEEQDRINSANVVGIQAFGSTGDFVVVSGTNESGELFEDPIQLDYAHIGISEAPDITLDNNPGVENNVLYAATIVGASSPNLFNDFTDGTPLSTRPGNVGSLGIDRTTGNVTASIGFGTTPMPPSEMIDFNGAQYQSAYLNDSHFGIASTGFDEGVGGFLVSGKATSQDEQCACEYLHWGYWAVFEDRDGFPQNARSTLGVFVAGQPTVAMPLTGSATYQGVVEAAWRQSATFNPTGIVSYASGSFNHSVQFNTGVGTGTMDLGPDGFTTGSVHVPGNANVQFTFTGVGGSEGRNGIGNGIFTGPNAENLGVTIELSGPNGFAAAGAIRAERRPINPPINS